MYCTLALAHNGHFHGRGMVPMPKAGTANAVPTFTKLNAYDGQCASQAVHRMPMMAMRITSGSHSPQGGRAGQNSRCELCLQNHNPAWHAKNIITARATKDT